ncbi:MAG: hypothetical protein EHM23_11330 [Acidobacteria bacterium]|nr:MAG: hypothetical protein EHM23_11330 [Acidobacteriota bacterium]
MRDFQVECYAGYRGDESPRAVVIRGKRYPVTSILQQWQEPGGRYFKLRLRGGDECAVFHDDATGSWLEIGHRAVGG